MRGRSVIAGPYCGRFGSFVRRFDGSAGCRARRPCGATGRRSERRRSQSSRSRRRTERRHASCRGFFDRGGRSGRRCRSSQARRAAERDPGPDGRDPGRGHSDRRQHPRQARRSGGSQRRLRGDLAALEAFYNERGEPLWMTDMGFSSEAQAAIDEVLQGRRLGPFQRGLRPAFRRRPPDFGRGAGGRRDQARTSPS